MQNDPGVMQVARPSGCRNLIRCPKETIDATNLSTQSFMPKGLMLTFRRDEILDLPAFIEAGGNVARDYFQP